MGIVRLLSDHWSEGKMVTNFSINSPYLRVKRCYVSFSILSAPLTQDSMVTCILQHISADNSWIEGVAGIFANLGVS